MNPSQKILSAVVVAGAFLFACGSSPEGSGPSTGSEGAASLVIAGVTEARCFGRVTLTIDGVDNAVVFPGPAGQGQVTVENGRVTIPVAPASKGPVEITDVLVEIPASCAAMEGAFEYLGATIALKPGESKEIAWSDFDEG